MLLSSAWRATCNSARARRCFVSAVTTVMQASENYSVDVVLALILIVSGVIGAQYGAAAGARLKGEQLRLLLAALVLLVCFRIGWDLVVTPPELFSISETLGMR